MLAVRREGAVGGYKLLSVFKVGVKAGEIIVVRSVI